MRRYRLALFAAAAAFCLAAAPPGLAQEPRVRTLLYGGVVQTSIAPPPLELVAVPTEGCDFALCIPVRIVATNISDRTLTRASIHLSFPEVRGAEATYGFALVFNREGAPDTVLAPGESAELEVEPRLIDGLSTYLASTGRSLHSLTKAELMVTHVRFADGSRFGPTGYAASSGR